METVETKYKVVKVNNLDGTRFEYPRHQNLSHGKAITRCHQFNTHYWKTYPDLMERNAYTFLAVPMEENEPVKAYTPPTLSTVWIKYNNLGNFMGYYDDKPDCDEDETCQLISKRQLFTYLKGRKIS